MKKLINKIMGNDNRTNHFEVAFGAEAAKHGEHGAIVGSWKKEGANNPITISFFFKGRNIAPKMTPEVIEELFHHAKMAGIDPTHLYSYGGLANPRPATKR
uniref:Uncharacterized protein n=1 Tax=Burkholderia phage vB_BgluM-SURPRISE13 TaxID=3159457 RepID=A0AAU7PFT1_9VIRU